MRNLPERPSLSRKKFTVSIPGEIEDEVRQRLTVLKMTPQQHYESLLAFDMLLEKAHIITGAAIKAGKESAWELWREIIAEFGDERKALPSYTEFIFSRLVDRSVRERKKLDSN